MALTGSMMNLKHKTSEALFSYWNKVRGNRTTPRRFEIEPGKIAAILPSTFILERIDAETYRFRLAGTHVCDMFGVELRGTNFLDGWSPRTGSPSSATSPRCRQAGRRRDHPYGSGARRRAPRRRSSCCCYRCGIPSRIIDRVLGAFSAARSPALARRVAAHHQAHHRARTRSGRQAIPNFARRDRARGDVPAMLPATATRASCAPSAASSGSSKAASVGRDERRQGLTAGDLPPHRLIAAPRLPMHTEMTRRLAVR